MLQNPLFKLTRYNDPSAPLAVGSSHKRLQLYDKETSISFFYSEIECCWQIRVNSGCCKINDQIVYSTTDSIVIVENSVDIKLNGHWFKFSNLTNAKGVSKILLNTLIKSKKYRIETEEAVQVIINSCKYYRDYYFILDAIRQNLMFKYTCGKVKLDVDSISRDIAKNISPVFNSIKYEMDNGIIKDRIASYSISKVWNSSDFHKIDVIKKIPPIKWPSYSFFQDLAPVSSDSESNNQNSEITNQNSDVFLPSPLSSSRYINSYRVRDMTNINTDGSKRQLNLESDSDQTNNEDIRSIRDDGDIRSATDDEYARSITDEDLNNICDFAGLESSSEDEGFKSVSKRRNVGEIEKRHKYHFEFCLQPIFENLKISTDSEQSTLTAYPNEPRNIKSIKKLKVQRSASCAEDGFLCEQCNDDSYISELKDRKNYSFYKNEYNARLQK